MFSMFILFNGLWILAKAALLDLSVGEFTEYLGFAGLQEHSVYVALDDLRVKYKQMVSHI